MSSSPTSPSSQSHVSRNNGIPANLILNWHSSPLHLVKPLVRRPKTACERCRTAKVKCPGDGERECGRCTSRGLSCRYAQSAPSPSPAHSRPRPVAHRTLQEDAQMDFRTADPAAFFGGGDSGVFQQMLDSSGDWSTMNDICPPDSDLDQHMDWAAADPSLKWSPGDRDLIGGLLNTSLTPPSTLPNTANHTPTSEEQQSLSRLGLYPFVTSTNASELTGQNLLVSQSCQCRSGLSMIIPSARAALQERRLDVVCEVTGDLVRSCQDIVDCRKCDINCTDLICIMSIFQEADVCFDYIANADIDGPITVSLGSYQTVVDELDAKHWRRMLVMQLVRRGNDLLNSISAKSQDMLRHLNPGCRLGRTNVDYLEAVIRNSKDNFQRIIREFHDEARMAR
ncbi:hypothetical protein PFICI_02309 [Pestalotiopsis fici W106-1]|uniref:Zn(2)-C6 fungal-type domain-containing protein n=1 Tax=Pestalotiopsis fici (strain W106-1 / CGMCC3.15140) TaxID=1229662 RepID=W3XE52_PESFW|nr:uncharacterized protein PFICI_02309 [Pestalotiopsis fici W106-1]ETS84284.1 hypothetical protein PFICI_02309 [Pestalotiopsis fici W106-1]